MAISKVVYKDKTLIDLTEDTVTESTMLNGATAHGADGEPVTGNIPVTPMFNGIISDVNKGCIVPRAYYTRPGAVSISSAEKAKLIPENIRSGVSILGVEGTLEEGNTEGSISLPDTIVAGDTPVLLWADTPEPLTSAQYTKTNAKLIIPKAGKYRIKYAITHSNATVDGYAMLYKNNVAQSDAAVISGGYTLCQSQNISCDEGDIITVRIKTGDMFTPVWISYLAACIDWDNGFTSTEES